MNDVHSNGLHESLDDFKLVIKRKIKKRNILMTNYTLRVTRSQASEKTNFYDNSIFWNIRGIGKQHILIIIYVIYVEVTLFLSYMFSKLLLCQRQLV